MPRTILVGRRSQVQQVTEHLAAVRTGKGRVAVIAGEAGIGKTRLLAEIVEEADRRGFAVWAAEPAEWDQARPFGAITDAFGVSPTAKDDHLVALAHLVHDHPPWTGSLQDTPVELNYLIDELLELFESMCQQSPVLVAIDNLHWADSASLAFLRRLAPLSAQYPVLVLAATRPSDRPEVAAFTRDVGRAEGARIDLQPLSAESVDSLAEQVLGAAPGPNLATELGRAGGNPLFVIELLSTLIDQGAVQRTAGWAEIPVVDQPVGLDATILHRFRLLPADTIDILRTAAIFGRTIDVAELALFMQRRTQALAEPLRAAARAGLVEAAGEQLVFRHEIIHDALYQDWPVPLRKSLHKELGTMLADRGAPAYRIAHHLGAGADVGDAEAVSWLHRAGVEVAPRAPLDGVRLLQRATELVAPDDPVSDVICTDLAVALVWAGRLAEGEEAARSVIAHTRDPEVRGRAAWWLANACVGGGRLQEGREVSQQALAAGVGSPRVRILLRLTEAIAAASLGLDSQATERMRQLLDEASRLNDPGVRSRCLTGVFMMEANQGRLDAALGYGLEAVQDAESLPAADMMQAPAHVCYVWLLEEQDRFDEGLQTLQRLQRLAGSLPRSIGAVLINTSTARIHFAAGRWDDALVELDSGLAWRETGTTSWADTLAFRAEIAFHRGQLAQARADLAQVERDLATGGACTAIDHFLLAQAFLLQAGRQLDQAVGVLTRAWQLAEDVPLTMAMPYIGPHLARWSVARGDAGTARRVAAALRELADANPNLARLDAAARWAGGMAEDDLPAILDAVAIERQGCRPLQRGFVCEDAAASLATRGSPADARALLHEAIQQYDGLGAAQRVASARARLRLLGVRTGALGRRRRPHDGWEGLTDAERRVVALVAKHHSNPEIAELLVVSRRTVETHVSHALAKLGLTSRQELAAARLRQEPPGPPG